MKARDNPFATSRVLQVRYQLQAPGWGGLEARLAALNHRAAIVGPHGSGKTTLLEDLAGRLAGRGWTARWIRLSEDGPKFRWDQLGGALHDLSSGDMILFDGAGHMGPLAWAWFKRRSQRAGGLVVTAHRPGLLPTLHECATHAGLLAAIAGRLVGQRGRFPEELARDLFRRHRGNLREALRELYDHCAAQRASWLGVPD